MLSMRDPLSSCDPKFKDAMILAKEPNQFDSFEVAS